MYTMSTSAVILIQSIFAAVFCYLPAVAIMFLLRVAISQRWTGKRHELIVFLIGMIFCVVGANLFVFRGHPDPNWIFSRSLGGLVASLAASTTVFVIRCLRAWMGNRTRSTVVPETLQDSDQTIGR
jgi:hypothetical protein